MRFAFRCYFREIKVFGHNNIPDSGPVLYLSNHPCSFTEPMLLACFQKRILNFLVRGDIFENRLLKPILEATHQIPIYRARDGFENLRKNKSTFDRVYQKLVSNETVLIFPESTTQCVRYLRPLQKGAAHMAIGSVMDHHLKDLLVIPCGVNFNNVLKAGEDVNIYIGSPIPINQWILQQKPDTDLASDLTRLFTEEMNKVVHSVPSDISPNFYNQLSTISFTKDDTQNERLIKHHSLIKSIHEYPQIQSKLIEYAGKKFNTEAVEFITKLGINDKILKILTSLLYLILGLPALVLFGIPLLVGKYIASNMIKAKEYRPPLRILFSLLMILTIQIVIFIILFFKFTIWASLISVIGLNISLYLFLQFIYYSRELKYLFPFYKNKKDLLKLRSEILKIIQ